MQRIELKEIVITEYLTTSISYRKLGEKYGVNFRNIHRWVNQYQNGMHKKNTPKKAKSTPESCLPNETKILQEELKKARLHNELLLEIIKIAEEELGFPLRKKSGTKRS